MPNLNRVFLAGHLGKDPNLKYTPSGHAVTSLALATSENYKDKNGEWQSKTHWHNLVVWGKSAERIAKCKKGDALFIEGMVTYETYEKDNEKKYITKIKCDKVNILTKPEAGKDIDGNIDSTESNQTSMLDKEYQVTSNAEFTADDIPF